MLLQAQEFWEDWVLFYDEEFTSDEKKSPILILKEPFLDPRKRKENNSISAKGNSDQKAKLFHLHNSPNQQCTTNDSNQEKQDGRHQDLLVSTILQNWNL